MKICIIGAGTSGIQTLNMLKDYHECHLFDKKAEPGGVWQNSFHGRCLQVPKELYEFIGFPSNEESGTFSSGETIKKYIQDYVEHYKLKKKGIFHMNEQVDMIIRLPNNKWNVVTTKMSYNFDYCIICTGMHDVPYTPEEYDFEETIHSSELEDAQNLAAKNVLVIGGGKSSIDCALESTKYAKKVLFYSINSHWPIPRYVLNIFPFKYITHSRLSHLLLPKHWNITDSESKWHDFFMGTKYYVFKCIEKIFSFQFSLQETPNVPLVNDLFIENQVLSYDFHNNLENGNIIKIEEEELESCIDKSDIIICGTGFTKDYSIFYEMEELGVEKDGLWLYKNILHPNIENLAFIGSEVCTLNNILTSYLQAKWLQYLFENEGLESDISISKKLMMDYIEKEKKWKQSFASNVKERLSAIQPNMTKYHDILMDDMKFKKVKTRWWEWFFPITAHDYLHIV